MSAAAAPVKKVAKAKKPAAQPKFSEMIAAAITALKDRKGSSAAAIKKFLNPVEVATMLLKRPECRKR